MNRKEAKDLFRLDVDSYGKPKSIMKKIDRIFDEFESNKRKMLIDFVDYLEYNGKNLTKEEIINEFLLPLSKIRNHD